MLTQSDYGPTAVRLITKHCISGRPKGRPCRHLPASCREAPRSRRGVTRQARASHLTQLLDYTTGSKSICKRISTHPLTQSLSPESPCFDQAQTSSYLDANNKRSSRGPPAVSLADHPRSQDITAAQGAPSKRTMEYPCSPQRRRSTRLCHKPAGTCTLTTMVWQVHTVHASRTDAPNTRPRSNSDSDGSDRSDRSYHSDSNDSDHSD